MDEETNRFTERFYDIAFDIGEAQKERCSGTRRTRNVDSNPFEDGARGGGTRCEHVCQQNDFIDVVGIKRVLALFLRQTFGGKSWISRRICVSIASGDTPCGIAYNRMLDMEEALLTRLVQAPVDPFLFETQAVGNVR